MAVAKRRRKVANDPRPVAVTEAMSCVVFARPYWNVPRLTGVAASAGFLVVIIAVTATHLPVREQTAPTVAASAVTVAPAKPYDIMVDASELAPLLPAHAHPHKPVRAARHIGGHLHAHAKPSIQPSDQVDMTFTAEAPKAASHDKSPVSAADLDDAAQRAAELGDLKPALRYQHRAAEREPTNMLYRLRLAILLDRSGDKKDAAILYRQVTQAYGAHDASLPQNLPIEGIRGRGDYLAASTGLQ